MTRIRESSLDGFLNVSKPYGWTSHDVVQVVRRLVQTRRVGHAGTLDPAAVGVLPLAVGRATRLVDYMADLGKGYCGDVVLGADTDTDDADGKVLRVSDPSSFTLSQVAVALAGFLGEIEQVPPQYSAVKLRGRKAYDIARRGGMAPLAAKRVVARGLAIVGWERPTLSLLLSVSKGFYVRSLARDLGEELGVGAHLGALVRVFSGPFRLDDAVGIEELKLAAEFDYVDKLIWPPDVAVAHLPALVVSESHSHDMGLGRRWEAAGRMEGSGPVRVYSEDGRFRGLAEQADGEWRPRLVWAEDN